MADKWTKDGPKITDPEALRKAQNALAKGPIFLRHALYHGGGSPHWDAVSSFEAFHAHIDHANPGDWLTLWSIPTLIDSKTSLIEVHYDNLDPASLGLQEKLSKMKKFLDVKWNEALFMMLPIKGQPEAVLNDVNGWEVFLKMIQNFTGQATSIYAFDAKILDIPEYVLGDAKVPNSSGEVPIGGAY